MKELKSERPMKKGGQIIKKGLRLSMGAALLLSTNTFVPEPAFAYPLNSTDQHVATVPNTPGNELISAVPRNILIQNNLMNSYPFFGQRLSQLTQSDNGSSFIIYDNFVEEEKPDGSLQAAKTMDYLHALGYDKRLEKDLGVPPVKDYVDSSDDPTQQNQDRINHFQVDNDFQSFLTDLKDDFNPGKPTSFITQYTDPSSGDIVRSLRTSRLVLRIDQNGNRSFAPIGLELVTLGLENQSALLSQPSNDSDIVISDYDLLNHSYQKGGVEALYPEWAKLSGQNLQTVEAVFTCENPRHDPLAANPTSTASGLLQETDSAVSFYQAQGWDYWKDRWDPVKNAYIGLKMFFNGGWARWSCASLL